MAETAQEGIGIWSEEHRRSGRRELSPDERSEVSRLANRGLMRGVLLLVPIPFLLLLCLLIFLCVATLPLLSGRNEVWTLLTVFFFGVLLGLTPLLLLKARDALREGSSLSRDAKAGWVEQFGRAGSSEEASPLPQVTRSRDQSSLGQARSFEVLPCSGVVWKVDGLRVLGCRQARRAAAADPPPYAAIAAEWVEPVAGVGDGGVLLGHRELSGPEQQELKRHLRKLTLRPLALALLLCTWLGLVLGLGTHSGRLGDADSSPSFLLLLLTSGASIFSLLRSWRLGQKLGRDLSYGRVVIARTRVTDPEERSGTQKLTAPEEFLPASGALWTRAGRPAPWRLRM